MIRLQRCATCGTSQYPPRAFCGACLSDAVMWEEADALPARVLARSRLHHSNEPRFRARLPLTLGLVQFAAGPVALCFLAEQAVAGADVRVRMGADDLLEAE
ncbi:MAG TPA: zinc ribbon domain-containing protein [Acetobacteraceae bacterium]|nr:zinc ribbon domain-containing protein [Acetobacteraceae bacterium]